MEMEQQSIVSVEPPLDLAERVRLIVELWGKGESVEGGRVEEIAGNLYGASPEEVLEAIIKNLREGKIRGRFYTPSDPRFRVP